MKMVANWLLNAAADQIERFAEQNKDENCSVEFEGENRNYSLRYIANMLRRHALINKRWAVEVTINSEGYVYVEAPNQTVAYDKVTEMIESDQEDPEGLDLQYFDHSSLQIGKITEVKAVKK